MSSSTSKKEVKPTIYIGTFIHSTTPQTLSYLHDTAVGVDLRGIITFITPLTDPTSATELTSLASSHNWAPGSYTTIHAPSTTTTQPPQKCTTFFFPGLLDTHAHAPQYPNTGIFGSSTLLDWLNTYTFPLESSFRSLSRARPIYSRVVARSLSHGTTTAAYYATVHVEATNLLADICLERGQRALVGRVCMDRMSPEDYRDESAESAIEDTRRCITHCEEIDPTGDIVRPVITPRFAPSCTDACLAGLGKLHTETHHLIQTHISENHAEIALVRSLFPSSPNYASVYDAAGLLTPRTILAHAVHLTPAEIALCASRSAKISHCPVSNSSLTSGACHVRALWDAGIDVGLGTDMSGGYSASVLEVTRQALLVSRHVAMGSGEERDKLSVEEGLWMATRGGARVVGLEGRVGGFEVGMEWDALMVCLGEVDVSGETGEHDLDPSTGPVDLFGGESWPDRVAKWVYTGDDRNVAAVWVKGRLVHVKKGMVGLGE